MQIAVKPFHGWRLPTNSPGQITARKEPFPIPDKSVYHQEALPALYWYQAYRESLMPIYSGLIGINNQIQSKSDFHWKPVAYRPVHELSALTDYLMPWSENPEILINDIHGIRHQISVIQTFPIIQEILKTLQNVAFECQDPELANTNPFICLALNTETPFPEFFPIGHLIAPSPNAENPSPFSAGF